MTTAVTPRIKFLKEPTRAEWIELVLNNLDEVMLDHSHCEKKAAGVALNMLFRYGSSVKLVKELTAIAREELEHFELVNQWLERKNIPLAPLNAPPYGGKLRKLIRGQEPERLLDSLLISALIEARSHERLGLIGEHCPEPELAKFYRGLMASEARHYGAYWVLATTYYELEMVNERLDELAIAESEILSTLHPEPRIHS
ncbi:MAG: tRNA isopentenyl-2-thiomethyl-A-37 hydroxylase MiaE [Limnothrix sp.]